MRNAYFLVIQTALSVNITRWERCKRHCATDGTRRRRSQALATFSCHCCDSRAQLLSQIQCRARIFKSGSLHRTPRQITTLSTVPNTRGQQPGFSRAVSTKNGGQRLLSCGSTGNVRPSFLSLYYTLITLVSTAGSGKSVIWCVISPFNLR